MTKITINTGDSYFWLGPLARGGLIENWTFTNDDYDKKRIEIGNLFLERLEAESYLEKVKAINPVTIEVIEHFQIYEILDAKDNITETISAIVIPGSSYCNTFLLEDGSKRVISTMQGNSTRLKV